MAGKSEQWVRMVDPTGKTVDVKSTDASYAGTPLDQGGLGYHIETPEEMKVREYRASGKADSASEAVKSFGEHLASTGSFGLSDALMVAMDPEYREARRLRDVTHTVAPVAGAVSALAVPLAGEYGGGLSLTAKLARAVGTPVSTVARAATAVGKGAERLVAGEAPGLVRGTVAKGLGGTLSGIVEGGAIGAGQAVSESAIEDKPLAADLLMARTGEGMSLGGGIGGALGAVSGLFGGLVRGAKPLIRHVPGIGEMIASDAESIANTSALNSLGFQRRDIDRIVKRYGRESVSEIGSEAQNVLGLREPGAFGRALKYNLAEGAEKVSAALEGENVRLHELYGHLDNAGQRLGLTGLVDRADREIIAPLRTSLSGSDQRLVSEIENELAPMRKAIERSESYKSIARAVPEIKQRLADLGTIAAQGEHEALRLGVRAFEHEFSGVVQRFRDLGMSDAVNHGRGILRALNSAASSNGRGIYEKFSKVADRFTLLDNAVAKHVAARGNPSITFQESWKLARKQGERVKNFSAIHDPHLDVYKAYWGILKDEISQQAERTGIAPELAAVNRRLRNLIALDEVARKNIGFAGNRKLGLTSSIAGAAGAAEGMSVGGGLGAIVGGIGGAALNRLISSASGDQLLAVSSNRYAALRKAYQESTKAERAWTRGARDAVSSRQRVIGLATRETSDFEREHQSAIFRAQRQADLLREFDLRTSEAREAAPELTEALAISGNRAQQYLLNEMPQPIQTGGIAATRIPPSIPESERKLWMRKLDTVKNPKSVLESLRNESVDTTQVSALRGAYPALYDKVRNEMLDEIEKGNPIPYEKRAQASIFTGAPVDPSYLPENIALMQTRYAKQRDALKKARPRVAPPVPMRSNLIDNTKTGTDKRAL